MSVSLENQSKKTVFTTRDLLPGQIAIITDRVCTGCIVQLFKDRLITIGDVAAQSWTITPTLFCRLLEPGEKIVIESN